MIRMKARSVALALGMTAVALAIVLGSQPLLGQTEAKEAQARLEETAGSVAAVANCRYGTTPTEELQTSIVSDMGAGWYLNFGFYRAPTAPANGAEFVHVVRIREDATKVVTDPDQQCNCADDYIFHGTYSFISPTGGLNQYFANYLKANPGKKYIVGNEVDRFGAQDGSHAEVYADAYYDIYHFIKSNDPTAQVGISGLVQFTPHRRAYLDAVWNAYIQRHGNYMPVDFWTMHIYILPELEADGSPSNTWASVALGIDYSNGKRHSGGDPALCGDPNVYCISEHNDLNIFKEQLIFAVWEDGLNGCIKAQQRDLDGYGIHPRLSLRIYYQSDIIVCRLFSREDLSFERDFDKVVGHLSDYLIYVFGFLIRCTV
ncbi:MAG: hypothetical protein ACK2UK_08690, partial [Candidatus Promineifilaceae bacterium]